MAAKISDLHLAKRGVAVLVTCVVQTLNESDPTFEDRFLKRLGDAYYELRDNSPVDHPDGDLQGLELLSWTRELLTGWDMIKGQGEPFLRGR